MKSIVLSGRKREDENLIAFVDDEDYPVVSRHSWYLAQGRGTNYARRDVGRAGSELMHHLIIGRPIRDFVVDHINNNGLDNRKENLRFLPNSENIRRRYEDNPYAGIYYKDHLLTNPWKAELSFGGKTVHVGYFPTQERAREARDTKLEELLGEAEKQ